MNTRPLDKNESANLKEFAEAGLECGLIYLTETGLKHQETFWITAEELTINGNSHFQLTHVKHTRRPSTIQFNRLLASGEISVDHMIKDDGSRVHERGPQFKIKSGALQ